jgi:hypothetical protein
MSFGNVPASSVSTAAAIRGTRDRRIGIKLAAIDQDERGCGEDGFRKAPPGDERLRLWSL